MKYNVITWIYGIKQYVRRYRASNSGRIAITMVTTNQGKAKDFGSEERATNFIKSIGIGYAIECNN